VTHRFITVIVFAALVMVLAAPPAAAIVPAFPTFQNQPAIVVDQNEEADEERPWTNRFLVPTSITVTALVLGGAAAHFLVRIKGRYRVTR
jgi:hypothetical protein